MSEQKRKVQLEAELNTTGVREGTAEIKREMQSMAQDVSRSAQTAGKAVDGIGAGGETSAKKVDAATKSMIQSIQRTTAAMEAGSKTGSKYFEVLASQRGVDVNALKPYLAQLDAVTAKQKAAEEALNATNPAMQRVGASAAQTAAALRMVPAQLTDIITSLASGQQPLTVLIQQGGQLKDMFGGIGPAARALGGYVAGLVNPFTLAAGAAAALGVAYFQGSQEANAYANALIMTGNAAGTSAGQLADMALVVLPPSILRTSHALRSRWKRL
jgi:phage-related minor tail protein